MKSAPILLVAFGLVLLYVVLSDKYVCFTNFLSCLTGADFDSGGTGSITDLYKLPSIDDTYGAGRQTAQDFCESVFGVGSWFCNTNILPGTTTPPIIPQTGAGGSW